MSTNLFARFQRLLPASPLLVADVIASGSGVSTVEFPGGDQAVVRGEATVATRVFVQGGVIQGPAPSLTLVLIDV